MDNLILVPVLLIIIGFAVFAVYRSKKSGKKCIGCPEGGNCAACSARDACKQYEQ
ncbi:MAG: FeoB-associated Cys-rich membrane protein [Clostridia bacterium]|nr:FeoB-associated Cys-rich membrane protein [Clostridia bacterium]MBR2413502.1 FeoB-associated Cys-rich membrane protein [Clostridia bacterium]MBR3954833.1 FeoB-associated Cys-rich membrane protein [Clostridia bacterium]